MNLLAMLAMLSNPPAPPPPPPPDFMYIFMAVMAACETTSCLFVFDAYETTKVSKRVPGRGCWWAQGFRLTTLP